MRRIALAVAAVSLLICGAIFTCRANPPTSPHNFFSQAQSKSQQFFGKIISQNGVRFILRDDENNVWYHLDNQEKAGKFLGKEVLITGTYDGVAGSIHVQNIVEAGPQDRPRPPQEEKKPAADPPKIEATPPASAEARESSAPQAIPPPPLVITAPVPPSDAQISVKGYASHQPPVELPADPAPDPPAVSYLSLPQEPVSASSIVAISSRRLIPLPPGSNPQAPPPMNLSVGRLLSHVDPSYPPDASEQRVEGTVELRAVIAEDGAIKSVETLSGPPLLVEASAAAIRHWRYSPILLDGHRIQTQAEIRLVFRLPQ